MCPRTDHGGPLNPFINQNEITLEKAKSIFDTTFLKQINFLQLCGNFGDPIVAKDTLEIFEYFRSVNPKISLGMHTNGSARPPDWWRRMGQILSRPGDYCKFALDGLEDTNHIYRRNTQWNKIMQSAQSFIDAGGIAHWEFLVFKHNQHQIEEARKMSVELGFKEFFVKKTSRFYNYKTGLNEPYPIYNEKSETIGFLEAPAEQKLVNSVSATKSDSSAETISCVECPSILENQIYISSRGEVFPCCFIAGEPFYSYHGPESQHLRKLFSDGNTAIDQIIASDTRSIFTVIDGPLFKEIENNFKNEESPIQSCQRICRKDFKIVKAEYQ